MRWAFMEGERDVGHLYVYILYNDLHQQPFAFIEDVFVEPTHRGRGIGAELVRQALREAMDRRCYKIIATSRFSRTAVHAWYEKEFGLEHWGHEFRLTLA